VGEFFYYNPLSAKKSPKKVRNESSPYVNARLAFRLRRPLSLFNFLGFAFWRERVFHDVHAGHLALKGLTYNCNNFTVAIIKSPIL